MRHTFRYLVPSAPDAGAEVVLSADDAHHLVRVVRRVPDPAAWLRRRERQL